MQKYRYKLLNRNESGQVLVILVFVAVVIFLFGAVMIDLGQVSCTRIRLQNAADASALATATYQARGLNAVADLNDEFIEERSGWNPGNARKDNPYGRIWNLGNFVTAGLHTTAGGTREGARRAVRDYINTLESIQRLQEAQVELHRGIIDRIGHLYLVSNLGNLPIEGPVITKSEFGIEKEGLERKYIDAIYYTWQERHEILRTPKSHWHKFKRRWGGHNNWRYEYPDDPTELGTYHTGGDNRVHHEYADDWTWEWRLVGSGEMARLVKYKKWRPHPHNIREKYNTQPVPAWLEKTPTPPLYAQVSLTLPAHNVILGGKILGITVPPISAVARAETYGGSGDKDGQMWNEYEKKAMLRYPNEGKPRAQFKARLVSVKGVSGVLH